MLHRGLQIETTAGAFKGPYYWDTVRLQPKQIFMLFPYMTSNAWDGNAGYIIQSDSQAPLKVLKRQIIAARIVLERLKTINEVDKRTDALIWAPGHSDIESNEGADCLANRATQRTIIGREIFCGIERRLVSERTQKKSVCHWKQSDDICEISRHSIQPTGTKKAATYVCSPSFTRVVIPMVISDADSCKCCQGTRKTSHHILYECEDICIICICTRWNACLWRPTFSDAQNQRSGRDLGAWANVIE